MTLIEVKMRDCEQLELDLRLTIGGKDHQRRHGTESAVTGTRVEDLQNSQ